MRPPVAGWGDATLSEGQSTHIGITHFRNYAAAEKRDTSETLESLAALISRIDRPKKDQLPWLKLARFGDKKSEKNSLRHDDNVLAVHGLEADYDAEQMQPSEAVEILHKAGVQAIVYTSPSHKPEKPRWRVLAPFTGPLPTDQRSRHMGRLNGLFGGILAGESWTLSQSYYYGRVAGNPAHMVEVIDGEPIDTLDELDAIWTGKPDTLATGKLGAGCTPQSGPLNELALIQAIEDGRSYHTAIMRLCGKWATQQNVPMVEAKRRLDGMMHATFPPDRDARWHDRKADIARCIEYAYGKESERKYEDALANGERRPPEERRQDAALQQQAEEKQKDRFTVLTPAQCAAEEGRGYIVKGLIAPGDHAQIIGLPSAGKSLLAPLMGYCIALGAPFFGHRVRQGRVLYLAAEDGHGMKQRTRALLARYGDAPDFLLVPTGLNLLNPKSGDTERVLQMVRDYQPVAVFIDTVARAFPGLRENDSDNLGMGRVVDVCRQITSEPCRPAVMGIHHVAKDNGITPRGHGCLFGDLDLVMLVEGERADPRTVRLGKNRNGPSDGSFTFDIEVENFGLDEDGDPITAPVAIVADGASPVRKADAEARLKPPVRLLLRELRDLIDRHGEHLQPAPGYPAVPTVTRGLLRSRLVDRGWFAEDLLRVAPDGTVTLERKGYGPENHALQSLSDKKLVSFNRAHVWLL